MNRVLMLALALSSASCRADEELPGPCQGASSPVQSIAPTIPNATERQVRGSVVVSVVVEEDGRVTNPVITRSQLEGLDRGRDDNAAYEHAALVAVAKWRFPPVLSRCTRKVTFDFQRLD
ncbi:MULTISPECIES: TonB family protein [Stenotrophomonas]|uniref:TonB family protein n=1 Tax=Stenotrophomonas TaxID=40323 RepID=UPI0018D3303C|nr:TonB family protein [Stenotrophomonas sp.]MBH1509000.1 TonB family protein [Stenotrophomonas maltophilia]